MTDFKAKAMALRIASSFLLVQQEDPLPTQNWGKVEDLLGLQDKSMESEEPEVRKDVSPTKE